MPDRVLDVLLDLLDCAVVDQRPDRDAGPVSGPDDHPAHLLREERENLVVDSPLDEDPVRAHAGLARIAELRGDQAVDGLLDGRVVEDDVRRVPAELEREPLHLAGREADQLLADLGRAGERDLADAAVAEQRLGDHPRGARGEQVHDAGRRACVLDRAQDQRRGERRRARGLHDARAACRHRGPELARHHRGREVPRRDRRGHADRLAQHEHAVPRVLRRERSGRRGARPRPRTTRRSSPRTRPRRRPRRAACPARRSSQRRSRPCARASGRPSGAGSVRARSRRATSTARTPQRQRRSRPRHRRGRRREPSRPCRPSPGR